jgi:peptidoglycan-associated lipoprotein
MKNYSLIFRLAGCALIALVLTGCPKNQDGPQPSDTLVGNNNGMREDWINEADVSYAVSEGLSGRQIMDIALAERPRELLCSVHFDFDSYSIKPTDRVHLQRTADFLQAHPQQMLLVVGHCDWYGTTEYNLVLGERRAQSVGSYLTDAGIDSVRMAVLSEGSLNATPNLSKPEAAKDRRADLFVLK